jgi:hypothetical protein
VKHFGKSIEIFCPWDTQEDDLEGQEIREGKYIEYRPLLSSIEAKQFV